MKRKIPWRPTPISSHVKDKNSIFTARDEDMIFLVKGKIVVFHQYLHNKSFFPSKGKIIKNHFNSLPCLRQEALFHDTRLIPHTAVSNFLNPHHGIRSYWKKQLEPDHCHYLHTLFKPFGPKRQPGKI